MEFALVVGVLLLIVGGIIEFGRLFWHYDALTKATRDGARLMSNSEITILHSTTEGLAKQLMLDEATGARLSPVLASSQVTIQCTYPSGSTESAWVACHDKDPMNPEELPIHVRASITGGTQYAVPLSLAQWLPLPDASIELRPQTTMRYVHNN